MTDEVIDWDYIIENYSKYGEFITVTDKVTINFSGEVTPVPHESIVGNYPYTPKPFNKSQAEKYLKEISLGYIFVPELDDKEMAMLREEDIHLAIRNVLYLCYRSK